MKSASGIVAEVVKTFEDSRCVSKLLTSSATLKFSGQQLSKRRLKLVQNTALSIRDLIAKSKKSAGCFGDGFST